MFKLKFSLLLINYSSGKIRTIILIIAFLINQIYLEITRMNVHQQEIIIIHYKIDIRLEMIYNYIYEIRTQMSAFDVYGIS